MPFNIDQIFKNVSRVKLRGGIVGKISYVLIFVAVSMAVIACSVKLFIISLLALCMIFILTFTMVWRLINFAHANPQAALMEGAELLVHEQMIIASKNQQETIIDQSDLSEKEPLVLTEEEKSRIDRPEVQKD